MAKSLADIDINDDAELLAHPEVQALIETLTEQVKTDQVTIKEVAGFTEEQMYGGYAAACKYLEMGQPLTTLQLVGWLLFLDSRNGTYYQLAGISAHHLKLHCLADYLYGLSLIYDPGNPITMIYRGEAMIFSEEMPEGLELIRQGIAKCGKKDEEVEAAKRGQALIAKFAGMTPQEVQPPG